MTPAETKALSVLPVAYQQILACRFKKPIKDYDPYDLERSLKDLIQVSFSEMGITSSAADNKVVTFLRETLMKDLLRPKFKHLSLESVRLFIANGIRGEYGTFKGQMNTLNIPNIHHWINKGMESREWRESLEAFNKTFLDQNTAKEPLYVRVNRSIDGIINAFEYYKKEGRIPFCGFAYYDLLNEMVGEDYNGIRTLVTDPQTRKRIFLDTEEKYRQELNQQRFRAESRGRRDITDGIDSILKNIKSQNGLINKQKEQLLSAYFDKLIYEERDLREILNAVRGSKTS